MLSVVKGHWQSPSKGLVAVFCGLCLLKLFLVSRLQATIEASKSLPVAQGTQKARASLHPKLTDCLPELFGR